MQTIYFEDHGQDFLEWDIDDNGVVVASRPFQADVWCGTEVKDLAVDRCPTVISPHLGEPRPLRYRVVRIKELDSVNT